MVGVAGCRPAGAAALRVSHQNGVLACTLIYLVNGGGYGLCHGLIVKIAAHVRGHTGVRRHLAEELIHGSGIVGELRAFVDNGLTILPAANAELSVPALIQRLGTDVTADGGSARFARRGSSMRNTLWPLRRNRFYQPSRPSGVVIQPMRDWP